MSAHSFIDIKTQLESIQYYNQIDHIFNQEISQTIATVKATETTKLQKKHQQNQFRSKVPQKHQQIESKLTNMLLSFFTDHNVRQLFVKQILMIPQQDYSLSIRTSSKIYLEINNHPIPPSDSFSSEFQQKQQEQYYYPNKTKSESIQNFKVCESQIENKTKLKSKSQLISQGSLKKVKNIYTISITKQFPIAGVRVYAIQGDIQPQIFDTRDLTYDCLGQKWSFRSNLYDIYSNLYKVDRKLQMRTEKFLSIQKTGQFQILDQFQMRQFNFFSSLNIFPNQSKQSKVFSAIGVTETHLLLFKQNVYPKKLTVLENYGNFNKKKLDPDGYTTAFSTKQEIQGKSQLFQGYISKVDMKIAAKYQQKKVFLSRFCDLQCINQIKYCAERNQIVLTILKYRSIKSFNQYQPLTKKYVFDDPQYFLRTVLKQITRFQTIKINLTPKQLINVKKQNKLQSQLAENDPQVYLLNRISETQSLQDRLYSSEKSSKLLNDKQRKTIIERLHKSYQKLIEYYSARAMPYYLIYVNKLNNLYTKYSPNIGQ